MKYISHRGNIDGKQLPNENEPSYIDIALSKGYDVEIDIWVIDNGYYLGHDGPTYNITQNWLLQRIDKIWIHCKNIGAVELFATLDNFNYFWHEEDQMTLTSKNYIWAYPGIDVKGSIMVLPELNSGNTTEDQIGICSDNIERYRK